VKSGRPTWKSRVKAKTQGRLTSANLTSLPVKLQTIVIEAKSVPLESNSIPVPLTSNLSSKAVTHSPIRNSQALVKEIVETDDMPETSAQNEICKSLLPKVIDKGFRVLESIIELLLNLI
jgi:hypothetical protein